MSSAQEVQLGLINLQDGVAVFDPISGVVATGSTVNEAVEDIQSLIEFIPDFEHEDIYAS